MSRLRLAVLASGSGTNLQAILDAVAEGRLDADVAGVICNVKGAKALDRAEAAGVCAVCLPHKDFPNRAAFEARLVAWLQELGADWVALAGFMRLLGPTVLEAFPNRITNIHPALLPAFPGLHAQRQALEKGVRITGVTVHLVDPGTDTGPILAQAAVPVLPEDDEASLSRRVQGVEHRLYPQVLQWIAEGRLAERNGRLHLAVPDGAQGVLAAPALPETP